MTGATRPIRVVFCWAEASGYMAACWQALAKQPGVALHIVHPRKLFERANPFQLDPLLDGLSNTTFAADAPDIDAWLLREVASQEPDVVVVCGWIYWPYTRLLYAGELEGARKVLGMDSPWRGTVAQRLARFRLGRIVRHADIVVTAGERSSEYARRIGVPARKIRGGFYGFDYTRFSGIADRRATATGQWPRQFLFVGRYVAQKDLATLVAAYAAYRQSVTDPWGLTCCGTGDDAALLKGTAGITDAGFIQPGDLPELFRNHGTFVLPSRFEPWGVVLAEAAASGLPIICTTACGAGVDLVRPYFNGLVTTPQDVSGLSRAMRWVHGHESELHLMGARGQGLSEAFSADAWAVRWRNYLLEALEDSSGVRA